MQTGSSELKWGMALYKSVGLVPDQRSELVAKMKNECKFDFYIVDGSPRSGPRSRSRVARLDYALVQVYSANLAICYHTHDRVRIYSHKSF